MWVIKMNLRFSLQVLHKCFTYLIPKMRRNTSFFLENNELSESTMFEKEYNQCGEVPFFVNTRRINIVETKISYSNLIPYARTNGEEKLADV
jgi:hypothetical protein